MFDKINLFNFKKMNFASDGTVNSVDVVLNSPAWAGAICPLLCRLLERTFERASRLNSRLAFEKRQEAPRQEIAGCGVQVVLLALGGPRGI